MEDEPIVVIEPLKDIRDAIDQHSHVVGRIATDLSRGHTRPHGDRVAFLRSRLRVYEVLTAQGWTPPEELEAVIERDWKTIVQASADADGEPGPF